MRTGKWVVAGVIGSLFIAITGLISPTLAENSDVSIGVGDTTFTVEGCTSPSALVTIMDGGSVIGTVTADSNGQYSQHFTAQTPGLHALKVYAEDRSNRTTTPVTLEVNVTEHAETMVNVFLPPSLQMSPSTLQQGEPMTIEGEGTPNATVIIYIDTTTHASIVTDSNGFWHYILLTNTLEAGQHELFVIAQQSGGNQSYPSGSQTFVIQATEPSPPIVTPPSSPPAHVPTPPVVLNPRSGAVVNKTPLDVSGIAEPGTRIEVWNNDKIVGSIFADSHGRWRLSIPLTESTNNIKTRSCSGDTCSDFSQITSVLFAPPGLGEFLWFELRKYSYHIPAGEGITLNGLVEHGEKPYSFVVEWGDGTTDRITSSLDAPSFYHRFDEAGTYGGTITITDKRGQAVRLYFTSIVDSTPISWPTWALSLALVLPVLFLFIWRLPRRFKI